MKHVYRFTNWRGIGLVALLALSSPSLKAQTPPSTKPGAGTTASSSQVKTTERPDVIAFRQELKQYEANRQAAVAAFLARNKTVRRAFTDANGAYHFLHHIDAQGQPVYYQTRSNLGLATSIGTSKLWSGGNLGLNLQGQDMVVSPTRSRLGMWEPGATRTTHAEFGGRAITRDTPAFIADSAGKGNADHATHVAGTMIAAGIKATARGMANQAQLDCYEIQLGELDEMEQAATQGMLVSNHSYGPSLKKTNPLPQGLYDDGARKYDEITFRQKNYLQFHAAGNDRDEGDGLKYDLLIGGAVAKNVATIGAVRILAEGYKDPSSVVMSDFSSYGPTDDGRIKPDFVAPGVGIESPASDGDDKYKSFNGTSMASPGAAGSLFLLQQHYRNKTGGFMRAATLKGLAIHTADEAGTAPGPDYSFGWGLLNLEKAINLMDQKGGLQLMEQTQLADKDVYKKQVTTGGGPFKTTICWSDVPGVPLANPTLNNRTAMLINDLDVRLINVTTGQPVQELPWKLNPDQPAAAATRGDNVVDNVEQIFIENLPAGQYEIQVSHKGTIKEGPQEFSLFVSSVASGGPVVKVSSTDPTSSEGAAPRSARVSTPSGARLSSGTAADPGFIRFERSNTQGALTVNYQIGGTATNGTDFVSLPTSVVFADGQAVVTEEIDPIDDELVEGDESIVITLLDGDAYDPDPTASTTSVTIKDKAQTTFGISGATTLSCESLPGNRHRLIFTPQYALATESPISFSVVNEMVPTTQPGPYTLLLYTDNAVVTLVASQGGTTARFQYNWLAACLTTPATPPPPAPGFAITGVTTVQCDVLSQTSRQLVFTPQYSGASGTPIQFYVVNETVPTTAPGPYTVQLYTDNPTVTLIADQDGKSASFKYDWLTGCQKQGRLGVAEGTRTLQVTVLGNPVTGESAEVEVTGAEGQPLTIGLVDLLGHPVHQQRIGEAAAVQRITVPVGRSKGMLLLRVQTPAQQQQVKLIRP
ncbi:hypothetical protein GCM10027578_15510 [Spirosoma luteolum]